MALWNVTPVERKETGEIGTQGDLWGVRRHARGEGRDRQRQMRYFAGIVKRDDGEMRDREE